MYSSCHVVGWGTGVFVSAVHVFLCWMLHLIAVRDASECFPSFLPCKVLILRSASWLRMEEAWPDAPAESSLPFSCIGGAGKGLVLCWLRDFRTYRILQIFWFKVFKVPNFKTDTDRSILFWNFDQESHLIALKITAKADQNIVRSPISSCLFCPGTWFQPIPIPRNVQGSRILEGIGGSFLFTNHNHVTVGPSWSSRWCPSSCLTTLRWAILMSLCMKSSQLVKHGITTPDNLFHVSHLKLILDYSWLLEQLQKSEGWSHESHESHVSPSCSAFAVGLIHIAEQRPLGVGNGMLSWNNRSRQLPGTKFCLNFTVMLLKTEDEWTQFLFGIWGVCAFVCWSLGDFGRGGDLQSVKDRKKFGP